MCAANCPAGWQIEIHLERGAGLVVLVDDLGIEHEFVGDEGLESEIAEALEAAKRMFSPPTGGR